MSIFLSIQSTYDSVEYSLCKDQSFGNVSYLAKEEASSHLINHIFTTLTSHGLSLRELDFIAVNQGPAPFTTLRTVIATVNGLSYSVGIPLIGVDGLEVLIREYMQDSVPVLVLLNAFNKAVYYGIATTQRGIVYTGYASIDVCIKLVQQEFYNSPFVCVGNGVLLHQERLKQLFPNVIFPDPLVKYTSLHAVAAHAYLLSQQQKKASSYLMPLYLKKSVET